MKTINAYAVTVVGGKLEKYQYELPDIGREDNMENVNEAIEHLELGKARYRIVLKA